jgi:iron complex transport system substrate-binding protein
MRTGILLLLGIIVAGCSGEHSGSGSVCHKAEKDNGLEYAKGFSVKSAGSYRIVSVFNPWQNSRDVTFRYILGKDRSSIPDSLDQLPFINIPVGKVITLSTTHLPFIDTLSGMESIVGISGSRYVFNRELRDRIASGFVRDIGYDQNLNYETMVEIEPDVIFLYGVSGGVSEVVDKIWDLRMIPVLCGDYLEDHPLGKVEWIKFFGEFYDAREEADSIFRHIQYLYNRIAERKYDSTTRPLILSGLPWKNTWYVPGGNSFAARLIEDAGGEYLWADNASSEALPLDLESVFHRAVRADIWINPGDARTLDELTDVESRCKDLPLYRSGQMYNRVLRISPEGGNDYWESGALRPDLILSDLFAIFHPDLVQDHQFTYYKKLK